MQRDVMRSPHGVDALMVTGMEVLVYVLANGESQPRITPQLQDDAVHSGYGKVTVDV